MCNSENNYDNNQHAIELTDETSQLKELLRVVNITRLTRIQASNRLLGTEHFVQHINIYYSCVAAVITVLSLKYPEKSYSIASAIMTVALAISIVYLNAQKYGSRAQQLQMNYLALHQLRFDIENAIRENDNNSLKKFQRDYVNLLQTSENHIEHDYRKTLWMCDRRHKRKYKPGDKPEGMHVDKSEENLKDKYKSKLFGLEWIKFFAREAYLFVLRTFLWMAPLVYFFFVITKGI